MWCTTARVTHGHRHSANSAYHTPSPAPASLRYATCTRAAQRRAGRAHGRPRHAQASAPQPAHASTLMVSAPPPAPVPTPLLSAPAPSPPLRRERVSMVSVRRASFEWASSRAPVRAGATAPSSTPKRVIHTHHARHRYVRWTTSSQRCVDPNEGYSHGSCRHAHGYEHTGAIYVAKSATRHSRRRSQPGCADDAGTGAGTGFVQRQGSGVVHHSLLDLVALAQQRRSRSIPRRIRGPQADGLSTQRTGT